MNAHPKEWSVWTLEKSLEGQILELGVEFAVHFHTLRFFIRILWRTALILLVFSWSKLSLHTCWPTNI
jgi:hypothetical protein